MKYKEAIDRGIIKTRTGMWRIGWTTYVKTKCLICDEECFMVKRFYEQGRDVICSQACNAARKSMLHTGNRRVDGRGYILVHMPQHPMADKVGRLLEHRLVMAQHLGRMLEPHEVVHHKDHNRQNNAIENLELVSSNREHHLLHGQDSELRKLKQEGMLRCSACREIKTLEAFSRSKTNRHGYDNQCKVCKAAYYKKTHPDNKPLGVKLGEWHRKQWEASENYGLFLEGKKQCRLCKEVKPLDAFSPNADLQDGKMSYCKQCRRERYGGKK